RSTPSASSACSPARTRSDSRLASPKRSQRSRPNPSARCLGSRRPTNACQEPAMEPRIVVVVPQPDVGALAREMAPAGFELVVASGQAECERALGPAEYVLCYPHLKMGPAFYAAAPRLKLVQLLSAGYDSVDLEAARRANVAVANNGGANAIAVAEHALLLMLAVSRRLIAQHANVAAGRWRGNGPAPRLYELAG